MRPRPGGRLSSLRSLMRLKSLTLFTPCALSRARSSSSMPNCVVATVSPQTLTQTAPRTAGQAHTPARPRRIPWSSCPAFPWPLGRTAAIPAHFCSAPALSSFQNHVHELKTRPRTNLVFYFGSIALSAGSGGAAWGGRGALAAVSAAGTLLGAQGLAEAVRCRKDGGKSERQLQQARLGPGQLGDGVHAVPGQLLVRAAATPLSLLRQHLLPLLQLKITPCSRARLRGAGARVRRLPRAVRPTRRLSGSRAQWRRPRHAGDAAAPAGRCR